MDNIFVIAALALLVYTAVAWWPELTEPDPRYVTRAEIEGMRSQIDRMETKYIRIKALMVD